MPFLRLAPRLQHRILSMGAEPGETITERALRRLACIGDRPSQIEAFDQMWATAGPELPHAPSGSSSPEYARDHLGDSR